MYTKVIVLVVLAISQAYAQTANQITCGQVTVPPMTSAQLWNWYSWTLPGSIAASNCYTGYLVGVQNALTDMYNNVALAGMPRPIGMAQQMGSQMSSQMGGMGTMGGMGG